MDFDTPIITSTAEASQNLGKELAAYIKKGESDVARVVCLYGQLGAGKTTFSQGFARALGITTRLLSPTFIIVRRYSLEHNDALYHIDLYRLDTQLKSDDLGLSDILKDPHAFVLIEWADRLGALLPEKRIDVTFEILGEEERKITIKFKSKIRISKSETNSKF